MTYKTHKGVAEQKDLGWFISCYAIDPYSQVPRMLPILKMDMFGFELKEGSEYRYELHLLQGNYVALLLPETDHVPDAKKMVEISDEDIIQQADREFRHFEQTKKDIWYKACMWYRQQLKSK